MPNLLQRFFGMPESTPFSLSPPRLQPLASLSLPGALPLVYKCRGLPRRRDRLRISALGSAEDEPVGKIETQWILVEDRNRMQRLGSVCVPVLEDEVFPMGILLLVV